MWYNISNKRNLEDQNHGINETQIAGFEFDNCLMNAAGVACMTIEELEGG